MATDLWSGLTATVMPDWAMRAIRERIDAAPAETARHYFQTIVDPTRRSYEIWCTCGISAQAFYLDMGTSGGTNRLMNELVSKHNVAIGAPTLAALTDLGWFDPEGSA